MEKIFSTIAIAFVLLALVGIGLNVLTGKGLTDITGNVIGAQETSILNKNANLKQGDVDSYKFSISEKSYINLDFEADNKANIYIMKNDNGLVSIKQITNSDKFSIKMLKVQEGNYEIVIEAEQDINYKISLVSFN